MYQIGKNNRRIFANAKMKCGTHHGSKMKISFWGQPPFQIIKPFAMSRTFLASGFFFLGKASVMRTVTGPTDKCDGAPEKNLHQHRQPKEYVPGQASSRRIHLCRNAEGQVHQLCNVRLVVQEGHAAVPLQLCKGQANSQGRNGNAPYKRDYARA